MILPILSASLLCVAASARSDFIRRPKCKHLNHDKLVAGRYRVTASAQATNSSASISKPLDDRDYTNAGIANVILSIQRTDTNINHFYRGLTWPLSEFLTFCFDKPLRCFVSNSTQSHGLKDFDADSRRGDTLFLGAVIYGACSEVIFDYMSQVTLQSTVGAVYTMVEDPAEKVEVWIDYAADAVRVAVFRSIKRGAKRMLGIEESTAASAGTSKSIIVYSREDEDLYRPCRISQSKAFAKSLKHLLPSARVRLLRSINSMDLRKVFLLFSNTNVVLTLHGGWAPNLMFMPSHSLVLSVSSLEQYSEWDVPLNSSLATIVSVATEEECSLERELLFQCVRCPHLEYACPNVWINCSDTIASVINGFFHTQIAHGSDKRMDSAHSDTRHELELVSLE